MTYPKQVLKTGRVRVCLDIIKSTDFKNKTVVDIGSSFGWLEKELKKLDPKKVFGIELNQEAVEFAKKDVPSVEFLSGSALDLPIKNEAADIAILFDVLEHVPTNTEDTVIKEVNRILKKDGILLFSTPNSNLFAKIFDIAWYFGHRHYSKENIASLFERNGFRIKKIETKGSILSSLYLTWFYIFKRLTGKNQPRFKALEKIDDLGYEGDGITDIFAVGIKK